MGHDGLIANLEPWFVVTAYELSKIRAQCSRFHGVTNREGAKNAKKEKGKPLRRFHV